jgi:hypothetical protein
MALMANVAIAAAASTARVFQKISPILRQFQNDRPFVAERP